MRTRCDQQQDSLCAGRESLLAASSSTSPRHSPLHSAGTAAAACSTSPNYVPPSSRRRRFVMYNKAPMWNETSQVYQLDFGGRVTQESAKNFQIEFGGKQVHANIPVMCNEEDLLTVLVNPLQDEYDWIFCLVTGIKRLSNAFHQGSVRRMHVNSRCSFSCVCIGSLMLMGGYT